MERGNHTPTLFLPSILSSTSLSSSSSSSDYHTPHRNIIIICIVIRRGSDRALTLVVDDHLVSAGRSVVWLFFRVPLTHRRSSFLPRRIPSPPNLNGYADQIYHRRVRKFSQAFDNPPCSWPRSSLLLFFTSSCLATWLHYFIPVVIINNYEWIGVQAKWH